jgi:hypothetical protein
LLGFLRKRREAKLLRQAHELSAGMMENVNRALDRWKAERLIVREELFAISFDERLVELKPTEKLPFPELAHIEALACLKNWREQKDTFAAEAALYLTDEDQQFLDLLGAGERFTEIVYERIEEVGHQLATHIVESTDEACANRGEAPFPGYP